MMNALKLFENTIAKSRLFSILQKTGEKLTDFLGDLKHLAMKTYSTESQDNGDHLVLRGFLEGINHSQLRIDL